MEWTFTGEVIEWRGPAPYLFVDRESMAAHAVDGR